MGCSDLLTMGGSEAHDSSRIGEWQEDVSLRGVVSPTVRGTTGTLPQTGGLCTLAVSVLLGDWAWWRSSSVPIPGLSISPEAYSPDSCLQLFSVFNSGDGRR